MRICFERQNLAMFNAPNLLSSSRIAATILVFALVLVNQPWAFLIATVVFFLASITDLLDGYLARRYHIVSPLGVFLDLTADKVFVSAILVAYVQLGLVPAWIVVIIIAREFLVTGLRSMAAAKGTVIPLLIADALMVLAAIWTVMSGAEYTRSAWPILQGKPQPST